MNTGKNRAGPSSFLRQEGMASKNLLRLAVLASWRAEGLRGLLAGQGPYAVVCGVITEPCSPAANLLGRRIPRALRDPRSFCHRQGIPLSDPRARAAFDEETARWLATYQPDLIVCCGYLYLLARSFLKFWPNKVLGIHDADLRLRNREGGPLYPGLRAVANAIRAGEKETRSTVYILSEELDAGPPLIVSDSYPVTLPSHLPSSEDEMGGYAAVHRERMIRGAWDALLMKTARLFCEGRIRVCANGEAFVDGLPAPVPASLIQDVPEVVS